MREGRTHAARRKLQGFTLLEVLLVIGILAMLVLLGLRLSHEEAERSRIEIAGQELQSIMQAAIYYHSVNHAWPEDNKQSDCGATASDTGFSRYYLPKDSLGGEEKSSFGTYYCWGLHNTDGNNEENNALFDLYLLVKGRSACEKAKRIAGTVPNAHAISSLENEVSDDCQDQKEYFVRSQVVPSAQSVRESSGQEFRALGQCSPDESTADCSDDLSFSQSEKTCCHVVGSSPTQYKIHFSGCDAGQTQRIVYLPAFITLMHSTMNYSPQYLYDRDYIYTAEGSDPTINRSKNPVPVCYHPSSESNELVCSLTLGVGMHTAKSGVVDLVNPAGSYVAGSVGAVYVASCVNQSRR